ncbi:MAG: class I SAM-dependent methyltransferase [Candidatus Thorarchaeota archaeon]|nr:MAG: class I SAM-dependent methyltransferase [Candidatus Thorarchaeota archaeon]
MAHEGKRDWTDEERVQRMVKSYAVRYDNEFWKSLDSLTGSGTRETVADFGCGPGLLLVDIANKYSAKVAIGVDESKEMLAQADTFLKERTNLESFELVQVNLDTEEIPVEPDSIDYAFSGFMLHEVASPSVFVSQVRRHIRSQGLFVVYDFISGNEAAFVKTMSEHGMSEEQARKRYPHMCKHSAIDIEEILQTSGFQDCRMIAIDEIRAVVVGIKR